jgi:hypothetical protein
MPISCFSGLFSVAPRESYPWNRKRAPNRLPPVCLWWERPAGCMSLVWGPLRQVLRHPPEHYPVRPGEKEPLEPELPPGWAARELSTGVGPQAPSERPEGPELQREQPLESQVSSDFPERLERGDPERPEPQRLGERVGEEEVLPRPAPRPTWPPHKTELHKPVKWRNGGNEA